jgi:hypothetical protein
VTSNGIVTVMVFASALIALGIIVGSRQLAASRTAKVAVTSGDTYRNLADEYRRLAEMAITAQEHADLKLTDISLRLEQVRDQLDVVQRILKDVE